MYTKDNLISLSSMDMERGTSMALKTKKNTMWVITCKECIMEMVNI